MKVDSSLKVCGVYNIFNTTSGFSYIGSSKIIYNRITYHFSALRGNRHTNEYLQHAFKKYGEDAFEIQILEVCTLDNLKSREEFHILNTPNRYNFIDKPTGPLRLPTPPAERIEIVRQKLTGQKRTAEQRKRMSMSQIGHVASEITKKKQSLARLKYIEENKETALVNLSKAGKLGIHTRLDSFLKEHPDGHKVEWAVLICLCCKKEFKLQPHLVKRKKYCSNECRWKSMKGKAPWNKGTKGLQIAWNKGLKVKLNAN